MDRRTTIKWMLAVSAAMGGVHEDVLGREPRTGAGPGPSGHGYGTDPKLLKGYGPGELWPLTFTAGQRRTAKVLCDLIIPADGSSPSASEVGVVEFVDEWISAPYERQRLDRTTVLDGFGWLDREASARHGGGKSFVALSREQQVGICDAICYVGKARPEFATAARFFALYRDLTAGGFYTTPQGRKDLGYVGNVALTRFEGPPPEVLRKVGLS
jgi:hypothetical protein